MRGHYYEGDHWKDLVNEVELGVTSIILYVRCQEREPGNTLYSRKIEFESTECLNNSS
jgi:hypothetical protein